ncbi:DUF4124 domain-containing protein [Methylophaga sulfidovorans]|uniref:DUF4124 domain-containing protein n=1 Tax=Methylophaga sulfidovorans TaxID=45496 RepID=A0A1I3ZUQ5_9GAMM|nr:DUF4124 domain-containing protein [Methylophaga sulfidovorans]SFK47825.1 protein of unknown function [Methylophaga sulfidovorans]
MLRDNLKLSLIILSATLSSTASADIYKWVDDQGQVHYSQQAPESAPAELIKTPPPPSVDPAQAQREVDALIAQQKAAEQEKQQAQQQAEQQAAQEAELEKQCQDAKDALTAYQNHPGGRFYDEDGNLQRIKEEDRQQKIQELSNNIKQHCQ